MSYALSGRLIYNQDPHSESGMICELSDPTVPHITHIPVGLSDPAWSLAMANGKRIIEAEDCFHLVQQLVGGQDWREWLERAANALIIVNNQYGNVESAMAEHSVLFGKPESEE